MAKAKSWTGKKQEEKVAAQQRAAAPVAKENGASPSNRDVLRRLYASMLQFRLLAEGEQNVSAKEPRSQGFVIGDEAILAGATLDLGQNDALVGPAFFAGQIARLPARQFHVSPVAHGNAGEPEVNRAPSGHNRLSWSSFNLGTGLALAQRLENKRNVVVALCAEDRSTADRWQEAMRFAGIHRLPVVFVLKRRSAFDSDDTDQNLKLEEVSFLARDCGLPTIIVDSKDPVAVWRVTQESIHRARNAAGPTLIECEVQTARAADPLIQMEHYMRKRDAWDDEWKHETAGRIDAKLSEGAFSGA